jgi:predicted alpha/beta-hydrolase family hydrolase
VTPRRAAGPRAGLLLTPGAGADRDQATLVAIDTALTSAGIAVSRMDFPYRLAGRKAPDRPPVLLEAVRAGAATLAAETGLQPTRIALGGRSMGGRMCSMAVAEGLPALALVLISYPLHPPGKPENLRTEHLPNIDVPCLFVSGTRDAFGTPAELEAAADLIRGPVTMQFLDGGDHGLRQRDAEVTGHVREFIEKLLG